MKADEVEQAGELAGEWLEVLVRAGFGTWAAVVGQGYRLAALAAGPHRPTVRHIGEVHTTLIHGGGTAIGLVAHGTTRVAAGIGARFADGTSVHESAGAHGWTAMLNGLHGERLRDAESALHLPMALRAGGADVALTTRGLGTAYPQATGKVVVFLHGLVETDTWWDRRSERHWGRPGVSYGSLLADEAGWTPVRVRYNTGLRVSDNGIGLAELLERLVAGWPVPVQRLALVGHSMGGLVAHSALAHAPGHHWPDRVCSVVTLGTPHRGSWLERLAVRTMHGLAATPDATAWADILHRRGGGIRDLRHGNLLPADWHGRDPDDLDARPEPVPLADGVRHCVLAATLPRQHDSWLARLVGDSLVRPADARPQAARGDLPDDDVVTVGGVGHLDLLNHPAVYAHLRAWLGDPRDG